MFLRHAGVMSTARRGRRTAGAEPGGAWARPRRRPRPTTRPRVHLPVRRQRLHQHGAAHRRGLVRPTTPRCAARRRTRSRCSRRARPSMPAAAAGSPAAAGRRAADRADQSRRGARFALHPAMGALQTMFDTDKRLAILPNVGPLILPTNKAQYGQSSHRKPANLFSHNDQQNTWQAFLPEGATVGWGGRMGDLLASMNQRTVFTSISAARQRRVAGGAGRAPVPGHDATARSAWAPMPAGRCSARPTVGAAMQRIVQTTRGGHVLEADLAAVAAALDARPSRCCATRSSRPATRCSAPRRPPAPTAPPTTRSCSYTDPQQPAPRSPTTWRSSCRSWRA